MLNGRTRRTLSTSALPKASIHVKLSGLCFSLALTFYFLRAQGTKDCPSLELSPVHLPPVFWLRSSGTWKRGSKQPPETSTVRVVSPDPSVCTCATQVRGFVVVTLIEVHLSSWHSQNQGVSAAMFLVALHRGRCLPICQSLPNLQPKKKTSHQAPASHLFPFLLHVIRLHCIPGSVVMDLGPQFTYIFWREFCSLLGPHLAFPQASIPNWMARVRAKIKIWRPPWGVWFLPTP